MNKTIEEIIQSLRINEYDFINITRINYETFQNGFDLDGIISSEKNTSEISLIAIKDYYVANITISKNKFSQIDNIVDFISKNSYYNKKLSVYYLSTYLKDAAVQKKINIISSCMDVMEKNKEIACEKIEQLYAYKLVSCVTSRLVAKIESINSYGVKRIMNYTDLYTEGLLKTSDNIYIIYNNKPSSVNIYDRMNFYKNKFTTITKLFGKVKISGYAIAGLLKQLMNVFNSDAINSNTTFIKTNYFGKKIFPSYIDIIDYPNCRQFYEKVPFDHSGIKTRKKYIVRNGTLFDLFGEINSSLRNGLAGPGNYYKKSSDLTNGQITYRNIIFNVKKVSKNKDFIYEIREFSLDTFLNIQTGIFSGKCYGFKIEGDASIPIVDSISIDVLKLFSEIQSISENKIYENVLCPDVIIDYKEDINDQY